MIGKNFLINLYLLLIFSINISRADVVPEKITIDDFFKFVREMNANKFLLNESDINRKARDLIGEMKKECENEELLMNSGRNQKDCYDSIIDFKIKLIRIKYNNDLEIIKDSYLSAQKNLQQILQENVRLIQNSSPEEDYFFAP